MEREGNATNQQPRVQKTPTRDFSSQSSMCLLSAIELYMASVQWYKERRGKNRYWPWTSRIQHLSAQNNSFQFQLFLRLFDPSFSVCYLFSCYCKINLGFLESFQLFSLCKYSHRFFFHLIKKSYFWFDNSIIGAACELNKIERWNLFSTQQFITNHINA